MAYERAENQRVKGDSLEAFVSNLSLAYKTQLTARNAEDEVNFNKQVLENDLSLDDQLEYRKEQLKRVSDDPAERLRIRKEISDLKNRIQQKEYSDEYTQKLVDSESGLTSIDSVIDWLETQRASTNDPSIIASIDKSLIEKNAEKFALTKNLLTNQTDYALKDRTDSVLDTQINRVTSAKNKALLAGDDTLSSSYDLQLQSLAKAKSENDIQKTVKNFAVSSITGYATATKLLDSYNNEIATASSNSGPVKIGDVTYSSAQEFWKYKRDSYIADNSDSGFFGRLNNEINTDVKLASSKNSLDRNLLAESAKKYDMLAGRPELAGYDTRLAAVKQDTLQTGANLISDQIVNRYAIDYDLNKAVSTLNSLKALGVNTDTAYTKIISSAGQIKSGSINNILAAAQNALQNDPNLTSENALNQAMASGAGSVLSPEQLATTPESKIVQEQSAAAQAGTYAPDARLTTTPANTPTPAAPPVVPTAPAPVAAPAPAQPTPAAPTPSILLNKQLDFGARDPQVKELQKFLNKSGFQVSAQGDGAPGFETDYFGPLTQAALQKFQAAKGIASGGDAATTGYGRLGPQTLKAIQEYKL